MINFLASLRLDRIGKSLEVPFRQSGIVEARNLFVDIVVFEVPSNELARLVQLLELLDHVLR